MIDKRYLPNFTLIFLGLVCISVWQIVGGPGHFPIITRNTSSLIYLFNVVNSSTSFSYPIEVLPSTDYQRLINIPDFHFNLLNFVCNQSSPVLLVLIHSDPKNFKKRKTIRETWGQYRKDMRIIFLLGRVYDKQLQEALEVENQRFKDFAQGSFVDAYRNMTYKHVMAFKYAIYHCPDAKFLLKTDDDVFVNTPTFIDFLNVGLPINTSKLILCSPFIHSLVARSYRSKWRVSFDEYKDKYYPDYCPGWAILYSPDVVFNLYREAQRAKYFWIDDVHITGTLSKKLNFVHTNVEPLVLKKLDVNGIIQKKISNPKLFFYGPPDLKQHEIRGLWNFVKKGNTSITRHRR